MNTLLSVLKIYIFKVTILIVPRLKKILVTNLLVVNEAKKLTKFLRHPEFME